MVSFMVNTPYMRLTISIFFFFLVTFWCQAQQTYSLKGTVYDSASRESLPFANVVLKTTKDSVLKATVTDSLGRFKLDQLTKGDYLLQVSFIGFTPYEKSIELNDQLDMGAIWLSEKPMGLADVTIEAEAEPVVVKEDTLEFNARSYPVPEGAELEELLKKLPGAEIKDGALIINGKRIEKVLVDGKPFFSTQINVAMKDLPADLVKKIQVIDEKSEEAQFTGHDDGKRTPVLNVVSKPEKKKGYFGSLSSTYSPPGRASTGGNAGIFKGDTRLGINARYNNLGGGSPGAVMAMSEMGSESIPVSISEGSSGISTDKSAGASYSTSIKNKLDINSSFSWSNSETVSSSSISRKYLQAVDKGRTYEQQSERENSRSRYSGNIKLRYKPNDNNHFSFSQYVSQSQTFTNSDLEGITFQEGKVLNTTENRNYSNSISTAWRNQASWRHKFSKEGRTLSIALNFSENTSEGQDSVRSVNTFTDGTITEQRFDQVSSPTDRSRNSGISVTVTEKTGEKSSLRFGYQYTHSLSQTERLLLDYTPSSGGYDELDPLRSSDFSLVQTVQEFNSGYSVNTKKLRISPNLSYETILINNDQTYPREVQINKRFSGLIPRLSIISYPKEGKQIRVNLSRSMKAPRATQLQDVLDNSNPLFLRQGNPDLKAGFSNHFSVNLHNVNSETGAYSSMRFASSLWENAITNYTIVGDGSNAPEGLDLPIGARYTRPVNISGAKSLSADYSKNHKVLKGKMRMGYGLGLSHSYSPQFINESLQSVRTTSYNVSMNFTSNFSKEVTLQMTALPRYSRVRNSNPEQDNSSYFSWSGQFRAHWNSKKGYVLSTNVAYTYNSGVNELGSFSRFIWNASVKRQLFKKKLSVGVTANDILRQLSDQNRNVSSEYIQNSSTELLRQVFRFSLSYRFSKFG